MLLEQTTMTNEIALLKSHCYVVLMSVFRLGASSALYALSVVSATLMFYNSTNYYLLHLGNALVVIFMNQERVGYVKWLYPPFAYAASYVALPFNTTVTHIAIASSCNVVEQILMHLIMLKSLCSLKDRYLFKSLRFLQVLFGIALPFSFIMAVIGTAALSLGEGDPFSTTLLVYTASHVSGNYLGLYTYYVLRGLSWQRPPRTYLRDLAIVCTVEVLLNAWQQYSDFRQAATVQIYPLLAYIAARYDQCYTALADVLVIVIVLVAVVLKRGPYYTPSDTTLSLFISLFIMLMYSACLTALLSFFMQQRRIALSNVSRLKDELFLVSSQVSHDVRAPLTHIISECENLRTAHYTASNLEDVEFSCQTIVDIMESWLIMLSESEKVNTTEITAAARTVADSHIENNKWMSSAETMTILLRKIEVYGNRVIQLSGKDLTLRTVERNSKHTLKFSNKMLQHVLLNLVSNSIKYSQSGEITVTAVFSETKHEICITVRDEGIGIASEHLPYLFERFYRVSKHKNADTTVSSFGVGLAIVESLVTKMQGSITVTSELGTGSAFTVTVPCHDVALECDEENQMVPLVDRELSKTRVLIAEDNKVCASLFTRQLSEVCASVKIIADGALVMSTIKECEYDVVLLDGSLPNQSGYEILTTLVQEVSKLSLVPVIVTITGGDSNIVDTEWHPLTVEHCSKPFNKQQLLAAIIKALRRQDLHLPPSVII